MQHPGNIFCLRDGRIAYVDFGNVAQLSNANKQARNDRSMVAIMNAVLLPLERLGRRRGVGVAFGWHSIDGCHYMLWCL